jgi:hypothetical protein
VNTAISHKFDLETVVIRTVEYQLQNNPKAFIMEQSKAKTHGAADTDKQATKTTFGRIVATFKQRQTKDKSGISAADEIPVEQELPIQTRECTICFDTLPIQAFPQRRLHQGCRKQCNACDNCIKRAVKYRLTNRAWERIPCMLCWSILPPELVRKYVYAKMLDRLGVPFPAEKSSITDSSVRYDTYMETVPIRKLKNFCWYLNPDCNSGQVHKGGGKQPKGTCKKCSFETCFNHQ